GEILRMAFEGQQRYAIRGTPSFVIDGKVHAGVLSFERFAQIVRPLLPAVTVADAWTRAAGAGRTGAGYMTLRNRGAAPDRLLSAASPAARAVELHAMAMDGGVMRMRPAPAAEIPAGGELRLAPGGLHLMLVDLAAPLAAGGEVPVTLRFERTGEVPARLSVLPPGARGPAPGGAD
ncbi:copper chaperone PCu(A)C, partial [Stella sp.]|uniref:copper chaperone PCu(A)C n=1 Tax=Stella sp. TaxID=2912054 RepID=UPI0035B17214